MWQPKVVPGLVALLAVCWLQLVAGQAQCGKDANGTLCADPTYCCSQYGYCGTSDDYCVTGCQSGPCRDTFSPPPPPAPPSPPSPPPPPRPSVSPTPSKGAGRIITRSLFESLYPDYNKTFYSYDAFIVAARSFPKFLNEGRKEHRLRELAAFSAHVQQETAGTAPPYKPSDSPILSFSQFNLEMTDSQNSKISYAGNFSSGHQNRQMAW